ncbi:hypothetical protein FCV25MIE_01853, partial [Fagus crenata]
ETASIGIHSDISLSQPVAGPHRRLKPRPSNVALGDYVAAVWGLQRWVLVGSHMGLIVALWVVVDLWLIVGDCG